MARIIPLRRSAPSSEIVPGTAGQDEATFSGGRDLLLAGALFWLASAARVMAALLHHEIFGVESSLAALCVLLLPWMCWRSRCGRLSASRAAGDARQGRRMGTVVPFAKTGSGPEPARDGR